jgi:hypothetical protein
MTVASGDYRYTLNQRKKRTDVANIEYDVATCGGCDWYALSGNS